MNPTRNHHLETIWKELEPSRTVSEHDEELDFIQFEQTASKLERYVVAMPTEQQTRALLHQLSEQLVDEPSIHEAEQQMQGFAARFIGLVWQQVSLFSWVFWVTSFIVIMTGAMLMPIMKELQINSFLMLIPLVSGVGVIYALRSYRTPMGELEATFPVSPVQLMLGRVGIVLLYHIFFALLASFGLSLLGFTGSLTLFIISWLVPLCLSTIFTLVCMLKLGTLAGAFLSLAVWSVQFFLRELLGPFYFISEWGAPYWGMSRLIGILLTACLLLYLLKLISKNKGAQWDGDRT